MQNPSEAKRILEAALLASPEPVAIAQLKRLFEDEVSADTVRRMFGNEPGVVNLGRSGEGDGRSYRILRIPRRVLNRVIEARAVQEYLSEETAEEKMHG